LPDGIFSNKKSQFGKILEGLAMEDVAIFYGRLVNFPAIFPIFPCGLFYILWPFSIFFGHLV
jgi:hypothetical protein